MPSIAIVDYGMGNLRSVVNAFRAIGADVVLASDPQALLTANGIVLPGVGAFAEGMQRLRAAGFEPILRDRVLNGRVPFLGLCLGLQLLATTGLEHGSHAGLGWIAGTSVRIPVPAAPGFRLPHVGWNDVRVRDGARLFAGLDDTVSFYFVHSYVLQPDDPAVVTGRTWYGSELVASVEHVNIHGTQFHPEKSHSSGLRLLDNFSRLAVA